MEQKRKSKNIGGIQDIIEFLEKIKRHYSEINKLVDEHTDFEYFPYESEIQNYIDDLYNIIGE